MTKSLILILVLLTFVGSGGFVQAYESPSYLLFHQEARDRLDSLELNPTDSNLLERIILMHNIAFHHDSDVRERAEDLLAEHFSDDTTPIIEVYRNLLRILKIRDRKLMGNSIRMIIGLFGGDNPYDEVRQAYANIRLAIQKDTASIQLRLLGLGAAVEASEQKQFKGLLHDAYQDLLWLQYRKIDLDSAETFFYNLSWAKYAYKYAIIKNRPEEAKKGFNWLIIAKRFASTVDHRNEADLWWAKINSLQTE